MTAPISAEMSEKLSQQLADELGLLPLAQQFIGDASLLSALLQDFVQRELVLAFGVPPADLMRQTNQSTGAPLTGGPADRPYGVRMVFQPAAPERDETVLSTAIDVMWRYGVFPRYSL